MTTPILTTKLYIPPPRPHAVHRQRLLTRLDAGLRGKLTLISAPAGFGKTTLVSDWLATTNGLSPHAVAWLSLDEGDSDPTRFLTYLVAALQTIAPGLGEGILGALKSPPPPPIEAMLTSLLNEITATPDNFVLVLDDYHALDAPPVDQAIAFLLEHSPPHMHLVMTTREDPQLPLARLRARGQLTELRAADLRFTAAEAASFLDQVMDLSLSAEQVDALELRTEGWIAGLQLAALSLRGRTEIDQFVTAFAGDNHYVVDYLVEEVLQRQTAADRSFLLQTSILDRLCGALCAAVTGQPESNTRLHALERGNFFVVPLDDQRHWYRYHHLFADVLTAHLRAEHPDLVPVLHQRACAWYAQQGSIPDALRHALAAPDYARAADLIELAWPTIRRSRQDAILLGWLKALPPAVLHARPVLCAAYAHVLLGSGALDDVAAWLQRAERWLDTPVDALDQPSPADFRLAAAMIVVDDAEFRRVPGKIALARIALALAGGDTAGAVAYARRTLDLAPEDDHMTRGGAAGFLGLMAWRRGDLDHAHATFAEGMASLQKAGNIADAINGAIVLATIRLAQGRLGAALHTYAQALQLATAPGAPILRGAADMHVGIAECLLERNELDAATQHLRSSEELGEHLGFPQNRYRWCMAMARIGAAQGDINGALDLLDAAERLYVSDFHPNLRPIAALKARLSVAEGRLNDACAWARASGLSIRDDLSYLHEFEHTTLARVLLAQYQRDRTAHTLAEAMDLLDRLLNAAEAGARMGSILEILVQQALAHQMQADIPSALAPLHRALTLAEPEGFVRLFIDEGPPMAALLAEAANQGIAPNYVHQLLSAFTKTNSDAYPGSSSAPPSQTSISAPHAKPNSQPDISSAQFTESAALPGQPPHSPVHEPAIDPLSARELDVLRLLRTDLSGQEMARQLMVSLNTLHTHTKNIYSKLGVNSRRAAVHRAEELHLF